MNRGSHSISEALHLAPVDEALDALPACLRPGGLLSIWHLMGSVELNAFQAAVGGTAAEDRLPGAKRLAEMLRTASTEIVGCEETSDWYPVQARKRVPSIQSGWFCPYRYWWERSPRDPSSVGTV